MTEKELNKNFEKEILAPQCEVFWRPPHAHFAPQDIFGIFDYITLSHWGSIGFFQITTSSNKAARARKMLSFCKKHLDRIPHNFFLAVWGRPAGELEEKWTIYNLHELK